MQISEASPPPLPAMSETMLPGATSWRAAITTYAGPSVRSSAANVATSVVPYLALMAAMFLLVGPAPSDRGGARGRPRPASWCARSSSSTTARTARSCRPSARNTLARRRARRAPLLPVPTWGHEHARPSRHGRRPRAPRRRRRRHADRRGVPRADAARALRLPADAQPVRDAGLGPIWALVVQPRFSRGRVAQPPAPQRHRHRRRARLVITTLCLARRLAGLPARPGCPVTAGRRGRDLALLRPAPVRGRLLGAQRGVELRRRRPRGSSYLRLPQRPALLHRQHRPAPRPPPQRADPELQAPARPRRERDLPRRPPAHAARARQARCG